MKKNYFLGLTTIAILLFSSIAAISANGDTILETWRNPQTGIEVFVNPYNHDNSVYRGPEYQAKILELIANGYVHKNYSITENTGGGGPTYGSYEEDYFVKTHLNMVMEDGVGVLFRTTPDGLQYWDEEAQDYLPVLESMEVPVEVEELLLQGIFDHDMYMWVGPKWYNWGWVNTGSDINNPMITIINEDGTEAMWMIMDIYGTSVAMMIIQGEEEWDTRTVIFELPGSLPDGAQLQPLYYGVQILGTLYGPQSIDEIPEELMIYAIEVNGQFYTYTGSPLDLWIYENIYKPNHAKSFIQD